jgi:hypothetical protein
MRKQTEYAGLGSKEFENVISKVLHLMEFRNPKEPDSGVFHLVYALEEKIRSQKPLDPNHLAAMNE